MPTSDQDSTTAMSTEVEKRGRHVVYLQVRGISYTPTLSLTAATLMHGENEGAVIQLCDLQTGIQTGTPALSKQTTVMRVTCHWRQPTKLGSTFLCSSMELSFKTLAHYQL